jgi:hypothetical protein
MEAMHVVLILRCLAGRLAANLYGSCQRDDRKPWSFHAFTPFGADSEPKTILRCFIGAANDFDRTSCLTRRALGHGPQKEARDAAVPVRFHDDHVGMLSRMVPERIRSGRHVVEAIGGCGPPIQLKGAFPVR